MESPLLASLRQTVPEAGSGTAPLAALPGAPTEGTFGSRWLKADDRLATGATCARVRHQVDQFRLPDGTAPQFADLYLTKGSGAFLAPGSVPQVRPAADRKRRSVMSRAI